MGSDIALVVGVLFMFLAVPALISAFSRSEPPLAATTWACLGGGLIVYAAASSPQGYRLDELPEVGLRVIAYFIR